ncbi:MAG: PAS domain S-box protein, partial [Spirochaetes bacterium]|nr:PAS domain S-box protein [Spirochaetota bacterium]
MNTNHDVQTSFPSLELYQDLLESNDLLEKMGEIGKIGAWKVNIKTNKTSWTKQLYTIYELDTSIPLSLDQIIELELPSYRPVHRQAVMDLMERGIPFDLEVETLTTKGNHRWLRIIGKGLYDPDGTITHRIGITQDITVRKQLEQKALENLRKYQTLFEGISDAVLLIEDETGRISDVNSYALTLYGYTYTEILGKPFADLCVEPEIHLKHLKERKKFVPLQWHTKKNGTIFPVELTLNCLSLNGIQTHIVVARDITDRINAEQKIRSLLQEKELLLKEVHHRIKNHMQTVTSLLQLQAKASEDPYVIEMLEEANNKLKSLGILYDKLYRT